MYSEYSVLITQWTMVHGTELTSDIPTIKPFMAINNSLLPCIVHNRYCTLYSSRVRKRKKPPLCCIHIHTQYAVGCQSLAGAFDVPCSMFHSTPYILSVYKAPKCSITRRNLVISALVSSGGSSCGPSPLSSSSTLLSPLRTIIGKGQIFPRF